MLRVIGIAYEVIGRVQGSVKTACWDTLGFRRCRALFGRPHQAPISLSYTRRAQLGGSRLPTRPQLTIMVLSAKLNHPRCSPLGHGMFGLSPYLGVYVTPELGRLPVQMLIGRTPTKRRSGFEIRAASSLQVSQNSLPMYLSIYLSICLSIYLCCHAYS